MQRHPRQLPDLRQYPRHRYRGHILKSYDDSCSHSYHSSRSTIRCSTSFVPYYVNTSSTVQAIPSGSAPEGSAHDHRFRMELATVNQKPGLIDSGFGLITVERPCPGYSQDGAHGVRTSLIRWSLKYNNVADPSSFPFNEVLRFKTVKRSTDCCL